MISKSYLKLLNLHLLRCNPGVLSRSFSIDTCKEDAIFKIRLYIHVFHAPKIVLKIQISVCPTLPPPVPERVTALPLQPACISSRENSEELMQLP